MGKLARNDERTDHGPVLSSENDVDGYTINFVTFKTEMDHSPLLKGLPGDSCQCPHWGYVIEGRMTWRFDDGREEVYEAGDAFYAPAGHVPIAEAGTEYAQFSPADELKQTSEAIFRNLKQMQGGETG
jgi:hypothetical protein